MGQQFTFTHPLLYGVVFHLEPVYLYFSIIFLIGMVISCKNYFGTIVSHPNNFKTHIQINMNQFTSVQNSRSHKSTLVHVVSLIVHPMQCHIRFLIMWRRERARREKKLLPQKTTTSRDNFTTIIWVVIAMQLKIFFFYMHKLNYIVLIDNLSDNSMYMLSVESTQI